jgi:histidyl-tRNA synthetase
MSTIEPRLLKGFRDYLPDQMIARRRMLGVIAGVFERYGFAPLETPALEYTDILTGKMGADAERLFYRFTDHGGRDVCLRYDLTVPLARVAAQYGNLPRPFKRYQIAPVWRAEKPGRGRFREFTQCDVDVVGTTSLVADAECVAVDNDVLTALGGENFVIRINHRKVLAGLLETLGPGPGADRAAVLRTIDKLSAMGEATVRKLLADENGLEPTAVDRVFEFLEVRDTAGAMIDRARDLLAGSDTAAEGLSELGEVLRHAADLGVPEGRLQIDFSIARGLDYYTGSVFETFLLDLPDFGSVMSGGRYDHLISTFLGRDMPAVGISMGIDRLFTGMQQLGLVEAAQTPTRVLVAPMGPETLAAALAAAGRLRDAGVPTEVYLEDARLKKQLKYADQRGIDVVVILGTDEVAANEASVKQMSTGEQVRVPVGELAQLVTGLLR